MFWIVVLALPWAALEAYWRGREQGVRDVWAGKHREMLERSSQPQFSRASVLTHLDWLVAQLERGSDVEMARRARELAAMLRGTYR